MFKYIITESAVHAEPKNIKRREDGIVEFIAILQETNKKNRNGRIYYKKVLEEALETDYVKERLRTRSLLVEVGHPSEQSLRRQTTIDPLRAAAMITELWWEGDLLKGRLETLANQYGTDLGNMIVKNRYVPAFSLRAQGNIHTDARLGATIVEAPMQIVTYDWVVNPSHDKAFLETICEDSYNNLLQVNRFGNTAMALTESADMFENGGLIPLSEDNQDLLLDYTKSYRKEFKFLNETYLYDETDSLLIEGNTAVLKNEGVTKRVHLNEYLLKDVRHSILNLTESNKEFDMDFSKLFPKDEHEEEVDTDGIIIEFEDLGDSEIEYILESLDEDSIDLLEEILTEDNVDTILTEGPINAMRKLKLKIASKLAQEKEAKAYTKRNNKINKSTVNKAAKAAQKKIVKDSMKEYKNKIETAKKDGKWEKYETLKADKKNAKKEIKNIAKDVASAKKDALNLKIKNRVDKVKSEVKKGYDKRIEAIDSAKNNAKELRKSGSYKKDLVNARIFKKAKTLTEGIDIFDEFLNKLDDTTILESEYILNEYFDYLIEDQRDLYELTGEMSDLFPEDEHEQTEDVKEIIIESVEDLLALTEEQFAEMMETLDEEGIANVDRILKGEGAL